MPGRIFFALLAAVLLAPAAARAQTTDATAGVIGSPVATSDTTHNFQFSVGFGYRF
jgi:hypothetical protein